MKFIKSLEDGWILIETNSGQLIKTRKLNDPSENAIINFNKKFNEIFNKKCCV
jgi:hypothetical protein